jgi:hypothetical protein
MTNITPSQPDPATLAADNARMLADLASRAHDLARIAHTRIQHLAETPDRPDNQELRNLGALFLRAAREARQIIALNARLATNAEADATRREQHHRAEQSRLLVDQARVRHNRAEVKAIVDNAITFDTPPEHVAPLRDQLALLLADLTDEDLVRRTADDNATRICHALDIVDRNLKWVSTRCLTPITGADERPP